MNKIFTQIEINKIQKTVYSFNINLKYILKKKNYIIFYYLPNKKVKCTISTENNYTFERTNSDGTLHKDTYNNFTNLEYVLGKWVERIKRDNPLDIIEIDFISKISPNFYSTYKDANKIYNIGLENSSAMIYRKSLEILFKDYLIYLLPTYQDIILNNMISKIIDIFFEKSNSEYKPREKKRHQKTEYNFIIINNELLNIKSLIRVINNTFKIGNDFSHYERNLENYKPIDMKKNIQEIIEFIKNDNSINIAKEKRISQNEKFEKDELITR